MGMAGAPFEVQAQVEEARDAVANIGFRPTVTGERPDLPRVEAHLLDFTGDLYGAFVELEFVAFLRDEQRFPNLEALKLQIAADGNLKALSVSRSSGWCRADKPKKQ
jgi:riboflavin kinase/FMN adenylyltransferase